MAEAKYSIGHSRKPKGKIGVGGQPVHSWDNDIELQPTSSLGSATSAQNTSSNGKDSSRHVVAQTWLGGSKQAFNSSRKKDSSFTTANFLSNKNAPVKVSVTGEWALQECEEFTNWTNLLMRRGRYRTISDIRRAIGDGSTLVHMLEILSGEKIPGVYARPITRAQKLENLQLCMSFMGNRGINLQGIYVGDLIDGNVNSVLSLCGNLRRRYEGSRADTPELSRPASSGTSKDNEQLKSYKLKNGHVANGLKEADSEVKPHGSSSGYHSEEQSPTRMSVPQVSLEMPGMMFDPDTSSHTTRAVHPTDVIVSTTKLDRKNVYQSGAEYRKTITSPQSVRQDQEDSDLISPSVEDRLRSLLCTPNPGGQSFEEDTEDEFVIPPRQTSDSRAEDRFDVEERLKSLLDDAAEGFDENEDDEDDDEQRRIETIRELDAIGYMPSHPSDKMRNIPSRNERHDSFTGRTKPRQTKLSTPPALRRVQNTRLNQVSQERSTDRQRKISVTKGPGIPMTKTTVSSTELPKLTQLSYHSQSNRRPRSFYSERDNIAERTPPPRERSSSHSEFLQQVASRLENEIGYRDTTTTSSGSVSPAETPMLPELSPGSSIASLVINSSSDSSGMITPVRNYYNKLKASRKSPRHSGTSTPKRKGRGKIGASNLSGHGKARSTNDLESIRSQIQSLESMYTDVLSLLDDEAHDSSKKNRTKDKSAGNQKSDDLRAGIVAFSKQRSKDIKAVNKRFGRLESHVVTLARSVAHLSSELRSQAALSQDLEVMRREINRLKIWQEENQAKKAGGVGGSVQYAVNLKRVNKLRKIFGEEPPLLVIFLKKLGYERFAPNFGAEQIGILELPYLSEERLQSLGIPLGPRLRIMEEASKLLA